jgi:glucose-1-phosphatase
MTNTQIKGIVFDLYGVNVHRNDQRTMEAFAERIGCSPETAGKAIAESGREQLKVGQITPRKFLSVLNKQLGTNLTAQELRAIWNTTLTLDNSMIPVLKTLKQRYKLFLLTNLNELDWYAVRQLDLANYFDDLFLSFELKMKKPNPQIFQEVVDLTGIDASNLLFIDDQMKNVTAASQLGMQAIQFKDSQTLHHQLHKLRLV